MKKIIRKSAFLPSKDKIKSNIKKFKQSETKILSNFSNERTNLIRANTKTINLKKTKTFSVFMNNEDLKSKELDLPKIKEINNEKKSLFHQQSLHSHKNIKKILIRKEIEDKYIESMKNKILKKISQKYLSPYISNLKDQEIHPQHKPIGSFTYYNYYRICNLINKKKCRFNLIYHEYLYINNTQEYLIRYFTKNEIYIIINYLLYIIYDKDIATISKSAKKILTYTEIKNMFNNLVNNNYNFVGTMEIMNDIAVYYKHKGNNKPIQNKNISNLDKVKPIYVEKIKYIYAKDIPNSEFPNCFPYYYQLGKDLFNCIKDYVKKRKFMKINRLSQNTQLLKDIKKSKLKKTYYNKELAAGNILRNISFSTSKAKNNYEESKDIREDKRKHNSFGRMKNDNDINDIEDLIEKILGGFNYKKVDSKKFTKKMTKKVTKRKTKRIQSMAQIPVHHIEFKENNIKSSKFVNFKELSGNALKKFIFKTSLKKSATKTTKNIIRFIKKNYPYDLMLNKNNHNYTNINTILKNFNENDKNSFNIRYLKSTKNNNNFIKNKKNKKIIRFDGFNNKIKNESSGFEQYKNATNNINNNSIKESSSNDSLFFYKIKNISKFVDTPNKNKYSINKYFSLKNIKNYSNKDISFPKKRIFPITNKRSFSSYSGINFDDKEVNIWENNKIDTNIINVSVKTNFLLNRIASYDSKNIKSLNNCNTLKKLIKYPRIYFPNF